MDANLAKHQKNITFLYNFKHDVHHSELCKLECRQLFDKEYTDKILFSKFKINPSTSPFIKNRLQIVVQHEKYAVLLEKIIDLNLSSQGFKVEYLVLHGDGAEREEKRARLKDIGYRIDAIPNFEKPSIIYGICRFKDIWYFGVLTHHEISWHKHNKKPHSFSSSIDIKIGKSLLNMVTKGSQSKTILDACCGVGTILLEGCISGFKIEGVDINPKTCAHARLNLKHYDYQTKIYCLDIKDLEKKYDAAIIDLPYNLYSYSNDYITKKILQSVSKISQKIAIVSTSNISNIIKQSELSIVDYCVVEKRGKSKFERKIWVCKR